MTMKHQYQPETSGYPVRIPFTACDGYTEIPTGVWLKNQALVCFHDHPASVESLLRSHKNEWYNWVCPQMVVY